MCSNFLYELDQDFLDILYSIKILKVSYLLKKNLKRQNILAYQDTVLTVWRPDRNVTLEILNIEYKGIITIISLQE